MPYRFAIFLAVASSAFALTTLTISHAAPTSIAAQAQAYSDLIERGIIRGDPSGAPIAEDAFVTRAVYAQLILNAFSARAEVANGAWPQGPIQALGARNVIPSIEAFRQAPLQYISREDAVLIAVRSAKLNPNIIRIDNFRRTIPPFSDEDQIAPAARSAAHLAVTLGIVATVPDGRYGLFRPKGKITMGESAVLIDGLITH